MSAALAGLAGAAGTPRISVEQAALFEGQGDVRLEGLVEGLHRTTTGWQATLHAAGPQGDRGGAQNASGDRPAASLALRGQGDPAFSDGQWVAVEGRIARSSGNLALLVHDLRALPVPADRIAQPSWEALATDPMRWSHRPLRLQGWVEKGELRDHAGHALQLAGSGWTLGPATIVGHLEYSAACLCHRLHASPS